MYTEREIERDCTYYTSNLMSQEEAKHNQNGAKHNQISQGTSQNTTWGQGSRKKEGHRRKPVAPFDILGASKIIKLQSKKLSTNQLQKIWKMIPNNSQNGGQHNAKTHPTSMSKKVSEKKRHLMDPKKL